MSDEAHLWLKYARENREVAAMSLERRLYNPCLQNAQQAAEKALKSATVAKGAALVRTHSIRKLRDDLLRAGADAGMVLIDLAEGEEAKCDLSDKNASRIFNKTEK